MDWVDDVDTESGMLAQHGACTDDDEEEWEVQEDEASYEQQAGSGG